MDIVAENYEVARVPKGKAVVEEAGRGGPSLASTTPVVDALSFTQPSLLHSLRPASTPLNPAVPDKFRSLSSGIVVTPPATITGPSRTDDSGSAATSVALDGPSAVPGSTFVSTSSVPVSPSAPISSTSLPCDDALGLVVVLEPPQPQSQSSSKPWASSVAGPGDAATAEVSPKRETFLSPSITSNHRGPVISSPAPVLGAPASIDGTSAAAMPDPQVIEDGIKSNVAEPILPSSSLAPKVEPQAPIVSSPSSQRELQSSPPLQSSEMPSAQTVALPSSFTTNAQSCSPIDTLEQNFKHRYRSLVSYSTITADTITTTTTTVSRSTTSPPPFPASSAIVPVSLASGASESSDVADDRHLSAPSSSSPPVLKTETETEMLINSRSTGLPSSVTLENDDDAYDHHPLPASSLHSALSSPPPSSNSTGHALERSSRDISTSFPSASVAVTAASGDLPPSGALESLGTTNCNPSIGSGTEHSATENATAAAARNTMITSTSTTQCNDDSYPATSLRNVSPSASTEPTVEVNANLVQNVDSGPPIAPPPEVLSRKPVVGGERGEGWPYGPEGWPQKDDKWPWKVGKRMHTNGYFKDRFLGLPKSLHKGKKITEFASKKSIVEYLRQTFPDLNVENFFKSFTWRVPCARVRNPAATVSKDNSIGLKRPRSEDEEDEDQEVEGGHFSKRPRECKAGNPNCGLVTGLSLLLRDGVGSLPCDICCTEGGFCRECKCILCCKIIAPAEENFVRCLHRPTAEPGLCGHAAHLQCAVHTKMAGVVKKKNLDMEYLCRRCDSKTDLRETVTLLLEAFGNIEQKSRAEMSLELTLELMRGTERGGSGAKVLESLVQSALKKVQDGADINGVYRELKDQGAAADAARHNQNVVRTPSNVEDVSFVEDSSVSFSPAARHNQNLARTSSNVEDLTQQPEASLDQWLQEGSPSSHPSPGTPSSFTSRLKSTPSVTSGHRNISPDVVESKGGGCGVVKHSPPGIDHSNASPEVETNSNYASNQSGGKAFARNRQKSSHIVRVGSSSLYSDLKAVSDKRMAKGSKGAAGGSVSEDEANVSQLVERGSTFTPRKQKGQSSSGRDCGVGEVCRACGGSGSMPPQGTIPSRGEHEPGPSDNSNNKKKRRVEGGRDANVNASSHGKDDADHGASTAHAEHDANITDAAPQIDEDSIRNTHFEASQDVNLGVRHTVNAQDNNCGECHENNADDRLGVSMVDNHDENARDDHHSNMSNHHDKNSCDGSRHVNVAERDAVMADGDPGDDNNTDIRHGRGADYDFEVLPRRDNVFGLSLDLMADEYDQHTEVALRYLKQAQDEEFELVKERLVAQKASILENYRLLEIARVRFSDQPEIISVPGLQAFDDLLMNMAEQYTKTMKEKQKFRKMLDVAGGFGQASTNLRRKFYDTQAAD